LHKKTSSRYVQKNNPKNQILGDKYLGVQTKRKFVNASSQENICVLSLMEPQIFSLASKNEHWVKSMNEELEQTEKN